jgi:hypothetical protein
VVEIALSERVVKGADTPPKVTDVAFRNPDPVICTLVPPEVGPTVALNPLTDGTSVKRSAALVALAPAMSATVMSVVPGAPAGATAVIDVSELAENVAETVPKSTDVALRNPDPVIVTVAPELPVCGLTEVIAGGPTVSKSCEVTGEVARLEDAWTWTVVDLAAPVGTVNVSEAPFGAIELGAIDATPPRETEVTDPRLAPWTVTTVPGEATFGDKPSMTGPQSKGISAPAFGVPRPVTMSYPLPAEYRPVCPSRPVAFEPVVMSLKSEW